MTELEFERQWWPKPMPKKPTALDQRDARIRELETALFLARSTIVDLMPRPLQVLLNAQYKCRSLDDFHDWQDWAVGELLAVATPSKCNEVLRGIDPPRARYPLCGDGAAGQWMEGFVLPVGLQRHLVGSHRVRRCGVFAAAAESCLERIREESQPGYRGPNWTVVEKHLLPWNVEPAKADKPERSHLHAWRPKTMTMPL